jgi:hypothetical protein
MCCMCFHWNFLSTYCSLVALKVLKATYVSTKQRGGENWFFEWLNINFMSMKTTTTKYFHNAEKLGKVQTKNTKFKSSSHATQ